VGEVSVAIFNVISFLHYHYYYYYYYPDQIYTPSAPESGAPSAAINSAANPAGNVEANGGSLKYS
jgi:hypothetical protein